ncbi:MAG: hypothetical protein KIT22_01245 [Verrucomicrobiae bacterium]|nr:hypothetical protein [Verrucomicrobiae bacterium]
MKHRFLLFRRGLNYYCEDTTTGRQTSLRTKDARKDQSLLNARNESVRQPLLNLQIARTYLAASDSALASLLPRKVIETHAGHFLAVLNAGSVSTNVHLRKLHNF